MNVRTVIAVCCFIGLCQLCQSTSWNCRVNRMALHMRSTSHYSATKMSIDALCFDEFRSQFVTWRHRNLTRADPYIDQDRLDHRKGKLYTGIATNDHFEHIDDDQRHQAVLYLYFVKHNQSDKSSQEEVERRRWKEETGVVRTKNSGCIGMSLTSAFQTDDIFFTTSLSTLSKTYGKSTSEFPEG